MEIEEMLDKKIVEGREYRNTHAIEVRAADEGKKTVEGYASTFDDPYLLYDWGDYKVYEKIDRHAFDDCDMSDVIMQYDHSGRVFARMSNNTLDVSTDDKGLKIVAELGGTTIGSQLYEEISGGYTTKMSFGFRVGEDKREVTEDHEHNVTTVMRTITKVSKLYDVSAVSLPANDATEISARSFCDGLIAELKAERQRAEERNKQKQKIRILLEVNK